MKFFNKSIIVGYLFSLSSIVNAQTVALNCESGDRKIDGAACWQFGAVSYVEKAVSSPGNLVITGNFSARSNQLTNNATTATWIKSPWLKIGNGNITLNIRLDGSAATSRGLVIQYVPYDAASISSSKEGVINTALNYTYTFPSATATTIRNISTTIPASIANNTTQVYKIMFSFIGQGGTGRAIIDDIVIPGTYWADPANNCLPKALIIDSDGDGVQDADDAYPKDAARAYESYFPSKGYATLLFEDLWPSVGDYDFNDMVISYNIKTVTNANGAIADLIYKFKLRAIGASLPNGFAFQLDNINAEKVYSITGNDVKAKWFSANKNGTEANQKMANIVVFDDAFRILPSPGGSGVNTIQDNGYVKPVEMEVTVTFVNPEGKYENGEVYQKEFTNAQFNPYLIVNQDRGTEIHLADYEPSNLINTKLFGQGEDNSVPEKGRYFKTVNQLPWALNVTEEIPYASEKSDFLNAYPVFAEWAKTNGEYFSDWYANDEKHRNQKFIYQIK